MLAKSLSNMGLEYNVKVKDIVRLSEGNWSKWARDIGFLFMEAGLSGYLDGSIEEPTEAKKAAEWRQYKSCIIGPLDHIINDSLAQELTPIMTAFQAWSLLKKQTQQDRMVVKLNVMRAAITTKFSMSKPTNAMIGDLQDLISMIFEGDAPTCEDWSIVLMINTLNGTSFD
jgi:hypothetical protein